MPEAFICDAIRTPIGRYGGSLSSIRADDLGAIPLRALLERNTETDWGKLDDVIMGCANQAGEDNRNVARMSLLLAGLPVGTPGGTINRLCGSGMDAIGTAARAIKAGEANFLIAGGVESMSRAPFVMGKSTTPFDRNAALQDTTMGWRFINPALQAVYGTETMPETAENIAERFGISRGDQDAFALRSQQRAAVAQGNGRLGAEITAVTIPQRRGDAIVVEQDEHPRAGTSFEALQKLATPFRANGTVTAGNASGINDGACALLLASEKTAKEQGLLPRARVLGMAVSALEPSIMGYGPVDAARRLMQRCDVSMDELNVVELNEAFAAQALAVTRALGLADDAEHVNPNGGAIALGHPLGMSGARLVLTATEELQRRQGRFALCAMCIGVGQGIAVLLERV
ncbi:MAG: 3-oxoadipyl-CoA thiolase [Congregibacter sp.]